MLDNMSDTTVAAPTPSDEDLLAAIGEMSPSQLRLVATAVADRIRRSRKSDRPLCNDCFCCYAPTILGVCGACQTNEFCENCGDMGPFNLEDM
jgi:hypothetical protein